jgi:spermidine/putrescine transport system ATP-binding protein
MEELKDRKTSQISGGQQQRVALARALAPRPKILLLDEPLSALDLKLRKEMQIELKRLQHETGITFIFVTHDQEEALTMSDRIAVMSKGEVLQVGGPKDIYDRPANRFVANFIGETNFLEGRLGNCEGGRGRIALASGASLIASLPQVKPSSETVSIVVRPEQARLVAGAAPGALQGTIENLVYFGTDTHYHLKLDDGPPFIVRQQNRREAGEALAVGGRAGVIIPEGLAQVLGD